MHLKIWEDHYPDIQKEYSPKALTWNQRSEMVKKLPLDGLSANSNSHFFPSSEIGDVRPKEKKTANAQCAV